MLFELMGVAALLFGLFFCAVGVLGVVRMPDSLTRLHASGKVATLGLFGLLLGTALLMPSVWLRLLALGLFVLLTSPVATHAIAASVHRRREIAGELVETDSAAQPADMTGVDVSAVLSRSRIQDIIEAQERARRHKRPDGRPRNDSP
ncbi:MAG: monovalent cation/H(+) antiporter subunit G [Chloroflexota bacterium]|nr:monovalent cation/H(+) antiporter subunit G [Chloroflexota bacterium]MDE2947591.1 monovalent cation/H(+) antiporter subunit G [Chloroflexota bacterium]